LTAAGNVRTFVVSSAGKGDPGSALVPSMLGFGHQFLPPAVNQKALRSSFGSLAKFAAMRRASSRVSRFGRRAMRRSNMSGIGG
jgi:hypothetical protein